jgi:hypothetical protein
LICDYYPIQLCQILNQIQLKSEEEVIVKSIIKSNPFGDDFWVAKNVKQFGLEQTLRKVGRPKTEKGSCPPIFSGIKTTIYESNIYNIEHVYSAIY